MKVTKDIAQLEQKINTLKEMIVELKLQNISLGIPIGHCPYAHYRINNSMTDACGDVSCSKCRQVFLNPMKQKIAAEVAQL